MLRVAFWYWGECFGERIGHALRWNARAEGLCGMLRRLATAGW